MGRSVVLVGKSDISVDYKTNEKGAARLAADAVLEALENTNLPRRTLDQADGVIAVPSLAISAEFPSFVAQYLETAWRTASSFTNGGSSPIDSINEAARRISAGTADFLVLCGGENLNTLQRVQPHIHMASMQILMASLYSKREIDAEAAVIPASYAFYGAAHAAANNISLDALQRDYAYMIAEFSHRAAEYAPSKSKGIVEPREVVDSEPVATPFTKLMCANPFLDQGAALLVMSEEKARALGISPDRWVYIHGGGYCTDHSAVEEEKDFSRMWAAKLAILEALENAGIAPDAIEDRISLFDIYSCFPSVVHNVVHMLGLKFENCRRFTTAGGLARRGGAGSLYSFSAVCAMMDRITAQGGTGLIYGLGGASSSHGACVLGKEPAAAAGAHPGSGALEQARRDYAEIPRVTIDQAPEGEADIVTYSVIYANPLKSRGHEPYAVCVGRRENRQFVARLQGAEPAELAKKDPADIIGRTCKIEPAKKGTFNMLL